jgi:hypothetical protein
VSLTNVTIAHDSGAASSGTLTPTSSGGIVMESTDQVVFKNTIVDTSPTATSCNKAGNTTGSFTSTGGNIDAGSSCGFTQETDQSTTTPQVSPVATNGGPVETAALLPASPAIGHAVTAGAPPTDARGIPRPAGSIDVGAFQLSAQGYWMVAKDGGIFAFGASGFYGSLGTTTVTSPIVGMGVTPTEHGYWLVSAIGTVFPFGDAQFHGQLFAALAAPIVAIVPTKTGGGYWMIGADGGVFSFGDATYLGSEGGIALPAPIVGAARTPDGNGYWMVGSDGSVYHFGDAQTYGSPVLSHLHLNAPVVGITPTAWATGWPEPTAGSSPTGTPATSAATAARP